MSVLQQLEPQNVFKYFEELSAIPRGSGNMEKVSAYCLDFAEKHGLYALRDEHKNVIIFKGATKGYENCTPVILQGHLDMVCQKTKESNVDFEKDGIRLKLDGDRVTADGTTLGADNGIAVAMILAVLEKDDLCHPAIEAVFTTDEEVGMVGARALDASVLKGGLMINLDSEEQNVMTVSCAGGSDFVATYKLCRKNVTATEISIQLFGLKGGHSGVCIHEGRVNANILAGRFLSTLGKTEKFDIISVSGGDKDNAIPLACDIRLCCEDGERVQNAAKCVLSALREELCSREPGFDFAVEICERGSYDVMDENGKNALIYSLVCTPNGVMDMSADIESLVETSLNLGILKTEMDKISYSYALRSNKKSALRYLEDRMCTFFRELSADVEVSGQYPPWEFKKNSALQKLYIDTYKELFGRDVAVEAIHAGLECGVFADKIEGLDCIAIGPDACDVHTVRESLSVSSVQNIFSVLVRVLERCK